MIASPINGATESSCTLSIFFSSGNTIEFVTTNSLIFEFWIRSIAGPDNTGCVQQAYTSEAPFSTRAFAANVIVPAVSMMSSIKIAL